MEFFEIERIVEQAFLNDVHKRYLWAYLAIAGAIFCMLYVFKAIALYTIASREGFKHKWMAFVPFFSTYYVGVVSEKNTVFKAKAKYLSLAAAILEVLHFAPAILYFVAEFLIFNGGYDEPIYETLIFGTQIEVLAGYNLNLPDSLGWAGWVYSHLYEYILDWLELAYMILNVFILISFFRTYASARYVLFSILSILFPIGSIFMFVVRNNRGKNYLEFLREQRQRQYAMYQEYMRGNGQNGQGGAGYGSGYGANFGGQSDPYAQQRPSTPPDDPFGGLGSSNGGQSGGEHSGNGGNPSDPFDDFNN